MGNSGAGRLIFRIGFIHVRRPFFLYKNVLFYTKIAFEKCKSVMNRNNTFTLFCICSMFAAEKIISNVEP